MPFLERLLKGRGSLLRGRLAAFCPHLAQLWLFSVPLLTHCWGLWPQCG